MAKDDYKPTTGRFGRLAKLASLSARLSSDVVSRGVKRFAGKDESILGAGAAEKLVATLGDLKGLAMKVGQAVSMDPDMLSPEVRAVVARLQNQAPPMPWETVHDVIAKDLGRPPEEAFRSFEHEPLASASLGQVHRAVAPDGTHVAVKVQYPDIARALMSDLDNLGAMVNVVTTGTRMLHGKGYYEELRDSLLEELDYREEARRAKLFAEAAAPLPDVKVPRIYDELTSEKVLTAELLEGETAKDFMHRLGEHSDEQKFRAARSLIRAVWGPFLLTGVIHADPHPGNFVFMSGGRVGVLDFGSIKRLPPEWVDVNRRLYRALVEHRPYDAIQLSLESGFEFDDVAAARPVVDEVIRIITRAVHDTHFDFSQAAINRDLKALVLKNVLVVKKGIRPPRAGILFFRAIGGLSHNLENLGAKGNFHRVYEELLALFPAPRP